MAAVRGAVTDKLTRIGAFCRWTSFATNHRPTARSRSHSDLLGRGSQSSLKSVSDECDKPPHFLLMANKRNKERRDLRRLHLQLRTFENLIFGAVGAASTRRVPLSVRSQLIGHQLSVMKCTVSLEAVLGPKLVPIIVPFDRGNAWRQYDPRLLGTRKYMDIGRQAIRFVERADADKANGIASTGIMTPQGNAAVWTANNPLSLAAICWCVHRFRRALHEDDAGGFDQCVESEGCTRFTLTPAAMTTVHEHGQNHHPIAHRAAGATASETLLAVFNHRDRFLPDARWERNSMRRLSRSPSTPKGNSGTRGTVRSQHPVLLLKSVSRRTRQISCMTASCYKPKVDGSRSTSGAR